MQCSEHSDANAAAVARAYTIARDSAELRSLWAQIEALDGRVKAGDQYEALLTTSRYLRHLTLLAARSIDASTRMSGQRSRACSRRCANSRT